MIAFEPYEPNTKILEKDREINKLNNITIVDKVLSDSEGLVSFEQPENNKRGYGSASINPQNVGDIKVPSTTGDRFTERAAIQGPNIVKIDVEGAEKLVIDGMRDSLTASECRVVYCEVHIEKNDYRPSVSEFGSEPANIKLTLENLGFDVEELFKREGEIMLKAKN